MRSIGNSFKIKSIFRSIFNIVYLSGIIELWETALLRTSVKDYLKVIAKNQCTTLTVFFSDFLSQ